MVGYVRVVVNTAKRGFQGHYLALFHERAKVSVNRRHAHAGEFVLDHREYGFYVRVRRRVFQRFVDNFALNRPSPSAVCLFVVRRHFLAFDTVFEFR